LLVYIACFYFFDLSVMSGLVLFVDRSMKGLECPFEGFSGREMST